MHKSKGRPLAILYTVPTPCLFNIPLLISFVAYCINGLYFVASRYPYCTSFLKLRLVSLPFDMPHIMDYVRED